MVFAHPTLMIWQPAILPVHQKLMVENKKLIVASYRLMVESWTLMMHDANEFDLDSFQFKMTKIQWSKSIFIYYYFDGFCIPDLDGLVFDGNFLYSSRSSYNDESSESEEYRFLYQEREREKGKKHQKKIKSLLNIQKKGHG